MPRVMLVVPPFHQVFIPAMGVSLLKAALARIGIACDIWYLNIPFAERIGPQLYTDIASAGRFRALAGEWVFAGDLFGASAPDPEAYRDEVLLDRFGDMYERTFADRLATVRAQATAFLDEMFASIDWSQYAVVGVSSTYQQSCAGLALLKRLKAHHSRIWTAMGGANCEGQMGAAIHDLFPFVDFVCSGEGDLVVPELIRRLFSGESPGGIPGILARGHASLLGDGNHAPMVLDLDRLPYPDYDDYFAQFGASSLVPVETPTLALETSRGCWWGEKHHCTFCGLNGGTMQYRSKSPCRALEEIDFLVDRYPTRKIYAIDNILDLKYFDTVLAELASRARPPRLFYETKANLTKHQLRLLARAGVWGIQPGIESLSTPILRLMDKGISALQNVRLLKWCAEIGLEVEWNFLYGFPGEQPSEYTRLADLVSSLTHLQPPAGLGRIRMDRFSPYFDAPAANGMVNVRASLAYRHVFPFPPAELDRLAYYFDYDHADGHRPGEYTADLGVALAAWRDQTATARLGLLDTGERLEIRDTRSIAARPVTILEGPARLAYLALDAGATAPNVHAELCHALANAAPTVEELTAWLDSWEADRLVLREEARYLSLATDPAQRVQLPVDRFLSQLAGEAS